MPALTINGITIPVLAAQGDHAAPILTGDPSGRAFSGALLNSVRARKEAFPSFRTTPQTLALARSFRALIQGLGHSFGFDTDRYADGTGLGPSSGTTSGTPGTASGKWGGHLLLPFGSSAIVYPANLGSAWTVIHWRKTTSGGVWEWWAETSTGLHYKNGAAATGGQVSPWVSVTSGSLYLRTPDSFPNWVDYGSPGEQCPVGSYVTASVGGTDHFFRCTVSSDPAGIAADAVFSATYGSTAVDGNAYEFVNDGAATMRLDDLVALPYVVPTSWLATLYTEMSTRAWTPLPKVRVDGNLLNSSALTMQGVVRGGPLLRVAGSADRESVEFSLEET